MMFTSNSIGGSDRNRCRGLVGAFRYVCKSLWMLSVFGVLTYAPLSFSQSQSGEKVTTPAAVIDVVYAQQFFLREGYTHFWREEKPFVKNGTLVIFKVNPLLVVPRNIAEPVLYVGNQTAERLNSGSESGYVVAIVPGDIDLAKSRAWFGSAELPERVNEKVIAQETELANKQKIASLNADVVRSVTQQPIEMPDLATLLRDHVAELVLKYSPSEKALVDAWRLPVATR